DGTATSGAITINDADQTLEIGATGNLTITAAQTVSLGKIQLDGGTLTDTSGIVLGSSTNNGSIQGSGKVAAHITHGGTGTASMITGNGGTLEVTGTVTSMNTLRVGSTSGDKLQLDGASSATTVTFLGTSGGTLQTGSTLTVTSAMAVSGNTLQLGGTL